MRVVVQVARVLPVSVLELRIAKTLTSIGRLLVHDILVFLTELLSVGRVFRLSFIVLFPSLDIAAVRVVSLLRVVYVLQVLG